MNKKAILKQLVKEPEIKNLLNKGFSRSIVNRLIVEELINEDENKNQKIKQAFEVFQKWLDDNKTFTQQAADLQKFMFKAKTIFKPTEKQPPNAPVRPRYEEFTNLFKTLKEPLKEEVTRAEWKSVSKSIEQNIKGGKLYDAAILLAKYTKGWTEILIRQIGIVRNGIENENNKSLTKAMKGDQFLLIFRGNLNVWNQIYTLTQAFVETYKKNPIADETETSEEIPPLILKYLMEMADTIVAEKLKGMNTEKIKKAEPEEIKAAVGLTGTLDDDNNSVSTKDIESAEKRGIPKDTLDALLARGRKIMGESVLTESVQNFQKFIAQVKAKFKVEDPALNVTRNPFADDFPKFRDWFESDTRIKIAVEKIEELLKYPGNTKISDDLGKPSEDEEERIVDETKSVTKQVASKVYSKASEDGGASFGDKITAFMDGFMKAKYIKEQTDLFNDLLDAIEKFPQQLDAAQQRATNESVKGKTKNIVKEAFDTKEVSGIKKAELGFLKSLDLVIKNLEGLEKNGQQVLASKQKQFIVTQAEKMQDEIKTLFDLISKEKTTEPLQEAERVFKSRAEKVAFVKEIFGQIEPRLQQFDELMTSWENEPGDEEIQIKDIVDSLDFFKKRLTRIKPFFDTKNTYFTKNKIEINKLTKLLKQMKRAFAIIYKSLKPATETGNIEQETKEKVLDKLKAISTAISKYIGPTNKIGDAPVPEVTADDDKEADSSKPPEVGKNYKVIKDPSSVDRELSINDVVKITDFKNVPPIQISYTKISGEEKDGTFNIENLEIFNQTFEKIDDTEEPELPKVGEKYKATIGYQQAKVNEDFDEGDEIVIEEIEKLEKGAYKVTAKKEDKRFVFEFDRVQDFLDEFEKITEEKDTETPVVSVNTYDTILESNPFKTFLNVTTQKAFLNAFFKGGTTKWGDGIGQFIIANKKIKLPEPDQFLADSLTKFLSNYLKIEDKESDLKKSSDGSEIASNYKDLITNLNTFKTKKVYQDWNLKDNKEEITALFYLYISIAREIKNLQDTTKENNEEATSETFNNLLDISKQIASTTWTNTLIKPLKTKNKATYPGIPGPEPEGAIKIGDTYRYLGTTDVYDKKLTKNAKYNVEEETDKGKYKLKRIGSKKESQTFATKEELNDPKLFEKLPYGPDFDMGDELASFQREQIERKLEILIERYINQRKQQWQKRTM